VDVYFDNVGGPILERVLRAMNVHGRIVCCGVVSQYDTDDPVPGPRGVPGLLTTKRLRMEGFIVHDHVHDWPIARSELEDHIAAGRLRVIEDVIEGLDQAPQALIGLLEGSNLGKRVVRVAQDPAPTPLVPTRATDDVSEENRKLRRDAGPYSDSRGMRTVIDRRAGSKRWPKGRKWT